MQALLRPFRLSFVSLLLLFLSGCHRTPVDDGTLRVADGDTSNWLMYGRTYDDHRYSPLDQINEHTVSRLGLAWTRELGTTRGLEATPLVKDGVLYTTAAWSVVHAIDAKTGASIWTYDPKVSRERAFFYCCDVVNRGVALYGGRVYVGTLDARLIALDERTGAPLWNVDTAERGLPYSITAAPRIARGMVIVGNAGSEFGVRGYVSAYEAANGKLVWRSYTVPGDPARGFESKAMENAAKTWSGEYWKAGGGGTAWEGVVYDPELDLLYFGTGNPTAWYRSIRGDGDNLYSGSIVAVRAATGEIVWHFQTTPGDSWDYDAAQPLIQAELRVGGNTRHVILQANKNGFFYVLDRKTGEFISGAPFVSDITWATGLDAKGRPLEVAGAAAATGAIVSPGSEGAHNWNPMALSPKTGLVYFAVKSGTHALHAPDRNWKYDRNNVNVGYDVMYDGPLNATISSLPPPIGKLVAWDPVAHREAWSVKYPTAEAGGVLVTGNLVFQGRADGVVAAFRATDGKQVWSFDVETGIMAPPVTYMIGGSQYVSVMAGWGGASGLLNPPTNGTVKPGFGRIVTFKLDGGARLKAPAYGHTKPPPAPAIEVGATKQLVHEGELLYGFNCAVCHGVDVISGPLPDLRYSSEQVLERLDSILLGGTRAEQGMPSFQKILDAHQVRAIQAYIVSRARESALAPVRR